MIRIARLTPFAMTIVLHACASSSLVSTWTAPDAQPLEIRGTKVAAVVMMSDTVARRAAEDVLAREIAAGGAVAVPMYTIYSDPQAVNEPAARVALEQAAVQTVVVMRPLSVEKDVDVAPVAYTGPTHGSYWGDYYGAGWSTAWGPGMSGGGDVRVDVTVAVETLVYSLKQNKLVWTGQSRTTNPASVEELIQELAASAAKELRKQGLLAGS
jgi:hypothetical protein